MRAREQEGKRAKGTCESEADAPVRYQHPVPLPAPNVDARARDESCRPKLVSTVGPHPTIAPADFSRELPATNVSVNYQQRRNKYQHCCHKYVLAIMRGRVTVCRPEQ